MTAAIKNYEGDEISVISIFPAGPAMPFDPSARLKPAATEYRCPSCSSIVYSRRHEICSICGEYLPESCRFTSHEARQIESLFETERARHRGWMRKFGGI